MPQIGSMSTKERVYGNEKNIKCKWLQSRESDLLSAWHKYALHDSPSRRSERATSGNQMRYAPHYLKNVHKSTTR